MDISYNNFLIFVFLLGTIQGLILTVLLFLAKYNKIANGLLGWLTLMWSIILILFALKLRGVMTEYPHLLRTVSSIEFTFFPLLYLNIKYLLKKYENFNKRDLLHFLPLVFNIFLFSRFYFESAETKLLMVSNNSGYYYVLNTISDEILGFQGIIYSIITLIFIRNYNSQILNYRSNNDKTLIRNARAGVIALLISWTIGTIYANLYIFGINIHFNFFVFIYLIIVIIIYMISYTAISSGEVFKLSDEQISHSNATSSRVNNPLEHVSESTSKNPEFEKLNEKLISYMNDKKPFLNPDLSFQELADELQFSRHQLSGIINQLHGVNFYEFVNTYRVDEVKKALKDPNKHHFKILSLAYDAGFNSKASFNRIFKQITAQTPSQYMNSIESNAV